MKIVEISIRSLFGRFNHTIQFFMGERVTIIHGPNGVGKTTVLRLIYALFNRKYYELFQIPFDSIHIKFQPSGSLTVNNIRDKVTNETTRLVLKYRDLVYNIEPLEEGNIRSIYSYNSIERFVDNLERVDQNLWRDNQTNETFGIYEVMYKYGHLLPEELKKSVKLEPELIRDLYKSVNITLVETQRLIISVLSEDSNYRHRKETVTQKIAVDQFSSDMIMRINKLQQVSGIEGAKLDQTFPQRLLKYSLPKDVNEKVIRERYSEQTLYRDRLIKAGIIGGETSVELPKRRLTKDDRKVLCIYLDDVQKKLKVFDNLLVRIELFKNIINSRFLYKSFEIDKDKGFIIRSNHEASCVPPSKLSSGEQHELVLAYQLLFKTKANSLIFIDEPELSLHVSWQRQFLSDISKISKLANLDFLIATHSPTIISDRRDLMVKLADDEEDK